MQLRELVSFLLIVVAVSSMPQTILSTSPTGALTKTVTLISMASGSDQYGRSYVCEMGVFPLPYSGNVHLTYTADSPVGLYVLTNTSPIDVALVGPTLYCSNPLTGYDAYGTSADLNLRLQAYSYLLFVYVGYLGQTPVVSITMNGTVSRVALFLSFVTVLFAPHASWIAAVIFGIVLVIFVILQRRRLPY